MNQEKRRRVRRIKKLLRDSPEYKLQVFWRRYKHNFSSRNLIRMVREIDFPEIQILNLKEFVSRDKLTFADFYTVLSLPKEVLALDSALEEKIWKQCFDISTPDNLRELLDLGETKAGKELFRRIDTRAMSMGKAKQILISLFERSGDEEVRNECWKRIEAIGPNEDELKYLLDSKKAHKFSRYIERMLARRALKKEEKAINKIKEFVAQIKQGQE